MAPHRRSSGGGGGPAAKQQRSIASFFSPAASSPAAKKVLVIDDASARASNPEVGIAAKPLTHDRQEQDAGNNDKLEEKLMVTPNDGSDDRKSKESPRKRPADDNVCGSKVKSRPESSKSLKRLKQKVVYDDGDEEVFLEKMDLGNSHSGRTRRSSSVSSESATVKSEGAPKKRLRKKYVLTSSDDDSAYEGKCAVPEDYQEGTLEDKATTDTTEIQKEDTDRQQAETLEKIARFKEETVRQIEPATTRADECCEADRSLLLSGEALERFGGRISRKFSFLGKYRKDASGRCHDWPNYDSRTLFLPAEFVKGLTGGQRQWWEFKAKHTDKVLLFKMGKFYEMFEMDAHVGAQDLDLQYMKGEQPHCGFPEKNYFENVEKLVRKGHRVLVVEQTETPEQLEERKRKTGSKDKVVRREICAVITKGTVVDSGMISDNAEPSFLAAITEKEENDGGSLIGLCVVDTSRALFMLGQVEDDSARTKLRSLLTELRPVELVLPLGLLTDVTQKALREQTRKPLITQLVPSKEFWDAEQTTKEMSTSYGASDAMPMPPVLQRFVELGASSTIVLSAFGGCISYLRQSLLDRQLLQLGRFESLPGSDLSFEHSAAIPEADPSEAHMVLDSAALENLEILENSSNGGVTGTLLCLLDHCISPFGRRLLKQWIVRPLCNIDSIVQRQNAVVDMQDLAENAVSEFRRELSGIPDLERLLARLSANSGENGRHAQKVVLYEDAAKKQIKELIAALRGFQKLVKAVSCFGNCLPQLTSARLRYLLTFGKGFPDLKPLLQYFEDSFDWSDSEANGRVTVGDNSDLSESDPRAKLESYLKSQQKFFKTPEISYVTVGKDTYLLEIPEELHAKVPSDYELRSSRKGFCRYWTPRVKELLQELSLCENEKEAALKGILQTLTKRFCDDHEHWLSAIRAVSELDALMSISCARWHMDGMTCMPTFVPASKQAKPVFRAKALRHPVMAVSAAAGTPFVPNDIVLGGSNAELMLLTGPNMGGKSTLLRQVCLGMILAQIGSEVPAESLELSLTDRLFVRMGAKDQIMTGQSTFLIELLETAAMLRCATKNSFVALDELGRGTATSDGQAIAHAVLHYLAHNVQCRGMFSSHYHKLASDFASDPSVSLYHMACKVGGGSNELEAVTFLYKLTCGSCPKSYGVNVARIAGMPESVLRRAAVQSAKLEKEVESHCQHGKDQADIIKTIFDSSGNSMEQLHAAWEKAKLL